MKSVIVLKSAIALFLSSMAWAQEADKKPLTLQEAVARAEKFPSIEASEEQVNAAVAGIHIARTSYLPSVNALGQINRATRNNVFGLLLPQSVVPNISGPVLGTDNGRNIWGSAAGVLVSWEPFDFGRRKALVQSAEATRQHAQLTAQRVRFDLKTTTAAAFLTLLAGQQAARAAQAAADRAQVLARSVQSVVAAKLRPGADLSRANTEQEAAATQLLQAEQSVAMARASLAEFIGADEKLLTVIPGHLLNSLPDVPSITAELSRNPAAQEQAGVLDESKARLAVLQHSYRPTFTLQGGAYGRGTGALTSGSTLGGWNGLAPSYFNVAAGITVNFPLLALPSLRAQESQEMAIGRSAAATYRQVLAEVQTQSNVARATLEQARQISTVTPREVTDARTGFEQANAQYHAGLTTIVAVAEAQRLLAQAEIDDSLAKLAVWRAWLQLQIAQGDISSFLAAASK